MSPGRPWDHPAGRPNVTFRFGSVSRAAGADYRRGNCQNRTIYCYDYYYYYYYFSYSCYYYC